MECPGPMNSPAVQDQGNRFPMEPHASSDPRYTDRYVRQTRFEPIGEEGQQKLAQARVLVCGCGALGSVIASTLVRSGVGFLRLVDRDFLEWNNLQRQVLYDEQDVRNGYPKAVAAAGKLRRINSEVRIEDHVVDVNAGNITELCRDVHVILDGTDNFETRFLLNDASARFNIPWIYGGCVGAEGQSLTILPGETPCLRCILPDAPPPGTTPTCDTAGILAPIVNLVASFQSMEAIKILSGHREQTSRTWNVWDLWDNRFRQIGLDQISLEQRCETCRGVSFPWLDGHRGSRSTVLCGRNAVQVSAPAGTRVQLDDLAQRLRGMGHVETNPFLLRFTLPEYSFTLFADGRAIVHGTEDESIARSIYARYVGA